MKNRTLLGLFCIVLAVAVTFGVTPIVSKMSAGKIVVVQVKETIMQGNVITADDIVEVEIGRFGVSDMVIRDEKQVVGKYAKTDLYSHINITPAMLSDNADSADDVLKTLDGTKRAVSITVPNFAAAVSGKLRNGDIVSIMVTKEQNTVIPAELAYVKVITTTSNKGVDQDQAVKKEDGTYDSPATITLLVNTQQAKLLAAYEANAKMHISLVFRGNDTAAQKFLDAQEKVFARGDADE